MNESDLDATWIALETDASDPGEFKLAALDVSTPSGAVMVGRDSSARLHLLVPVVAGSPVRDDRASRGVRIGRTELVVDGHRRPFLDVVCHEPALNDLFQKVAAEMLGRMQEDPGNAATSCHDVLSRWRNLLDRQKAPLGPEAQAGLFGELLALKKVIDLDPARRVDVWRGPTGSVHDLIAGDVAIEVKATRRREGRFVEIHGVEQLLPPSSGDLFLLFLRLDVHREGQSISELIASIKESGVDAAQIDGLINRTGFVPTDDEDRFLVVEERLYVVDDQFPKVVPFSFAGGALPAGVLRVRYEVDLTGAMPMPLDDTASGEVFLRLASAP